jgi:cellobiose phosphorylase
MSKFATKYGHFSDDGNEYSITNHLTPKPWINVISNGDYGMVISQAGGGFSWLTHSEFNRLNRWHQDLVQDNWGKYFYVKNEDTGEIWSPTWMPVKTELDFYQVKYGFGYAKFESEFKGVQILLTVFVPMNDQIEIWNFQIQNKNGLKTNLSIYSYFEWCLGSSSDQHREFHKTFLETEYHPEINCMTATKRLWEIPLSKRGHWNIQYPYQGFIACTKTITDYDGDKESFIGSYGSVEKPDGINSDKLGKRIGKWNDSVAVVKTQIELKPNETDEINFFIGIKKNSNEIKKTILKYQDSAKIHFALDEVKNSWFEKFDKLTVDTPDEALNLMVNKWLKYQAICGRLWARTAYYQQSGAFGYRDQLQDSLVFLPIDPSQTKKQIKLHAAHQFKDGTVLHWWHPITETGLHTKMTDDLLWLPFVVLHYINETGDYAILKLREPFYDDPKNKATIFDHCTAAIERVLKRFSKRGLPLIGAGDWNDGLSAVGLDMKGESIWLAEFLFLILSDFSSLCNSVGKKSLASRYLKKVNDLKKAFDKYAWDGYWFYRATKDNGEKIGSKKNKEGKIFLNAQTWSVISGIAEENKQLKAMDSVSKLLLKKNGTLLLYPAYTKPDEMIGYLSRYAPGRRENGGVYSHAAAWSIWAYALLKQNQNSFEAFKRLCPVYNGMNPDEYNAEPYVTPGNIDGPDSPNFGMGGWTWYTGSAAWYQKVIVDWILGIRATKEGLLIDPCIPEDWKEYSITRFFRNTAYNITVFNKSGSGKNAKYMLVNGERQEKNLLNVKKNKTVEVKVYL